MRDGSLAVAVANCFSFDIYLVSLLDRDLSDTELLFAMQNIPEEGCILLLEDIDSAGLERRQAGTTST